MSTSYKKLWKLLIDLDMTKSEMRKLSGISSVSLAKLGKNENVTTDILVKICNALNCDICDIMEVSHCDGNVKQNKKQANHGGVAK